MTAITPKQLTGRHVLLICLAFFGAMIAANTIFVVYAVSTFNGDAGGNAYQRGLDYNAVIEAARAQEALGWLHRIEAGTAGQISVALKDRSGAPITGLTISGEITRPVDDRFTRPLVLTEVQHGLYAANAGSLDAGNWIITLTATRGQDPNIIYRTKERLWLKPNS